MKKSFHHIVIIFLMILLIIFVGLNYYVDPANLYHDSSEEIAQAISEGHAAYAYGDNARERQVKYNLIQRLPDHLSCIAVGPSVIMGASASDVGEEPGGDGFYNLAVSSADYYDIMATLGMLDQRGITYDRIIIAMDPSLFDRDIYENAMWNQTYREYAYYETERISEGSSSIEPKPTEDALSATEYRQLISLTYAQRVVYEIRRDGHILVGSDNGGKRWGYADDGYPWGYFNNDASWVYSTAYDERTLTDIENDCKNYVFDAYTTRGAHMDEETVQVFEKLIYDLISSGVQVDLFVSPYAPTLYERMGDMEDYPIIGETLEYAHELAERYDLALYGDPNPATYGLSDSDFYDARHMRTEHYADIFKKGR